MIDSLIYFGVAVAYTAVGARFFWWLTKDNPIHPTRPWVVQLLTAFWPVVAVVFVAAFVWEVWIDQRR